MSGRTGSGFQVPRLGGPTPWAGLDRASDPGRFRFAILSDRTGLARPGVFERAIEVVNLLGPDFVIQVGDQIEGAADRAELERQWQEFDEIAAAVEAPLFRLPGNHDVPGAVAQRVWRERFGPLHYSFRYRDVLFVLLDTQDYTGDPEVDGLEGWLRVAESHSMTLPDLVERMRTDRRLAQLAIEASADWEGRMPAEFGPDQIAAVEAALAANADVRWTFVLMHMPAWQTDETGRASPGWDRIAAALGDRPFTAISGHVHNYRRAVIGGRDHIRLGPSGGAWVLSGDEGNFDQVALVTMTEAGPLVANVVLDGVLGVEGGRFAVTPRFSD